MSCVDSVKSTMYPVLSMVQLPIIIRKSDYYFVFILIELIE